MLCVVCFGSSRRNVSAASLGGKYLRRVNSIAPASTWMIRYSISSNKLGDVIKGKGEVKVKGQGGNRTMENKKNTGNKAKQKEEKAWKKVLPKSDSKKSNGWVSTLTFGASIV